MPVYFSRPPTISKFWRSIDSNLEVSCVMSGTTGCLLSCLFRSKSAIRSDGTWLLLIDTSLVGVLWLSSLRILVGLRTTELLLSLLGFVTDVSTLTDWLPLEASLAERLNLDGLSRDGGGAWLGCNLACFSARRALRGWFWYSSTMPIKWMSLSRKWSELPDTAFNCSVLLIASSGIGWTFRERKSAKQFKEPRTNLMVKLYSPKHDTAVAIFLLAGFELPFNIPSSAWWSVNTVTSRP